MEYAEGFVNAPFRFFCRRGVPFSVYKDGAGALTEDSPTEGAALTLGFFASRLYLAKSLSQSPSSAVASATSGICDCCMGCSDMGGGSNVSNQASTGIFTCFI